MVNESLDLVILASRLDFPLHLKLSEFWCNCEDLVVTFIKPFQEYEQCLNAIRKPSERP